MELALQIQTDIDQPLHRQVYEQIRAAILSGRLKSHQRLPASRELAKSLGISRTTVTQSYDQLVSEGYLQTHQGAGTFVCAQIPDELLQAKRVLAQNLTAVNGAKNHEAKNHLTLSKLSAEAEIPEENAAKIKLSDYGDRIQNTSAERQHQTDCKLSFRCGIPAIALFPTQQWQRLTNRYRTANTHWMNYSDDAMGYWPLREQIATYISHARAIRCQPGQILITHGTQQALSLITRLMIDPGDAIAIENPSYISARRIFVSSGAAVLPIPVDTEGLQMAGPHGLAKLSAKLVYVTPSHQFPTGVLMSLARRLALLQWAQQANALIIEDDYDSEFRYSGRPVPALQGLDSENRVLYLGTFSKVMFPGLRLGYMVLPPALVPIFRYAKWLSDRQCSLIDQRALTTFISEGHLAKHVRRMRSIYDRRRRSLVEGLSSLAAPQASESHSPVEILGDESGLHVMARLPTLRSNDAVVAQAQAKGVSLFSAQPNYWPDVEKPDVERPDVERPDVERPDIAGQQGQGEFIFGFGNIDESEIQAAIARISPLL
ncbi:MAG: GntR family transcriptional regulator / MocR family aminotransferase [Phormidesmis priestleyi Ana]|uniref:GntR family transcriptional regulator / MocR family aminotransferase n=1 Tax=Phormidesmis priestleyi Ana TaxID=1666911 RepID=A0A0P8BZM1_9CYAN|nr:MAG: GntR family transcriptional regulator / MocR family aminotransferase [Phormidesmis priestleyi Ana]